MKKLAIILHIYYTDLWKEFEAKLLALDIEFDLYISLINGNDDIESDILSTFPNCKVFWFDNKGLDVGPFFYTLKYFVENNLEYEYLIKLHTKKSIYSAGERRGKEWREGLVNCLVGSDEILKRNISWFDNNQSTSIAGAAKHLHRDYSINWLNDELYSLRLINSLENNSKFSNMRIVAGTMFMVRYKEYKTFFTLEDISRILAQLTIGYERDKKIEHKLERILSYIPQLNGSKILEL